jgi:hypothetical protein
VDPFGKNVSVSSIVHHSSLLTGLASIFYYAPWSVIQRRRERRLARHLENVRRDDLESARTVSILRDIGMSEARRLRHSPSVIIVPQQLSDFSRLVPEITPPQRAAVVMPESKWFDDRTAKREKLLRSAEKDQYKAFKGQQKKSSRR